MLRFQERVSHTISYRKFHAISKNMNLQLFVRIISKVEKTKT